VSGNGQYRKTYIILRPRISASSSAWNMDKSNYSEELAIHCGCGDCQERVYREREREREREKRKKEKE